MTTSTYLYTSLVQFLKPEQAGLALGITFGIKDYIPPLLTSKMRDIGASHILVLSGANITLFMQFLSSLLKFLPIKTREIAVLVLTILFLSFVPLQSSVIRAGFMSFLPRIGYIIGRKTHTLYLLLLTATIMASINISVIFELSFQLSFLAVLGMVLFLREDSKKCAHSSNSLLNYTREQVMTSVSAQVFTVPLIFLHFGTISLLGLPSSLLLAPFITPIMAFTLISCVIGYIFPLLYMAIVWPFKTLLFTFLYIVNALSQYSALIIHY